MGRSEKKHVEMANESGTFHRMTVLVTRVETIAALETAELSEPERKALLSELCDLLADPELPTEQQAAALTLAGRIARRTVTDPACQRGLCEMLRQATGRRG